MTTVLDRNPLLEKHPPRHTEVHYWCMNSACNNCRCGIPAKGRTEGAAITCVMCAELAKSNVLYCGSCVS